MPIPYPTLYAHSARWRLGKKVIYDLGVRKDVASGSKLWQDMLANGAKLDAGPDVAETLVHHGIDLKSINAVIWGCVRDSFRCSPSTDGHSSHPHIDHTGDPSTFPSTTTLVVGDAAPVGYRPRPSGPPLTPFSPCAGRLPPGVPAQPSSDAPGI